MENNLINEEIKKTLNDKSLSFEDVYEDLLMLEIDLEDIFNE